MRVGAGRSACSYLCVVAPKARSLSSHLPKGHFVVHRYIHILARTPPPPPILESRNYWTALLQLKPGLLAAGRVTGGPSVCKPSRYPPNAYAACVLTKEQRQLTEMSTPCNVHEERAPPGRRRPRRLWSLSSTPSGPAEKKHRNRNPCETVCEKHEPVAPCARDTAQHLATPPRLEARGQGGVLMLCMPWL